jgi:5-methylthioribose kinase
MSASPNSMSSSSTPVNHDLTTDAGVKSYLADTPFASHTIASLSGGSGNYTYRIYLSAPYEGQPTLVLKHAEPYVKASVHIPFGLERQVMQCSVWRVQC